MKLTKRQMELLQCLYKYPGKNLKELGKILHISLQTMKLELRRMEEILSTYNISIVVSNGNDLEIYGIENLPYMRRDAKDILEFSLEQQTMLVLLLADDFVVLQEIADILFVSKSSLEKLMASLLKKYPNELQSLRHYGIRCILPQVEKRFMFAKLLEFYFKGVNFFDEIKRFDALHFPLLQYFSDIDLQQSVTAIETLQSVKTFMLTDKSISHLFLCLLMTVRHHRKKCNGKIGDTFARMVDNTPGVNIYLHAAKDIARVLKLQEDPQECSYICYLMMTLRKQEISDSQLIVDEMQEVIQEIFRAIEQKMSIKLHGDISLFKGLALHIHATVLRKDLLEPLAIDYNWNDIRHQYPLSFEMAVIAAEIIDKKYTHALSNDEMIYLTLHFQASVERMKKNAPKIKAIVVCHYGMAASSLIATRVNDLFCSLEVIGSYSIRKFLQLEDLDCDLILTTEKIPDCNIPMLYVTPLLRENEIKAIAAFIETKGMNKILEMIVMEATVFRLTGTRSVQNILNEVVGSLQEQGYVMEGFLDSVKERERISSTDIGHLAIPHGDPDFVIHTKLIIVKLEKPLLWKVSTVKYIFLFAISREQFTRQFSLFSTFYKRMIKSNLKDNSNQFDDMDDASLKLHLARLLGE